MRRKLLYRLNLDELYRLCQLKGWGIPELVKKTGIKRENLWRMGLPPENPQSIGIGSLNRERLREAFPNADPCTLFLPVTLQECRK